MREGYEVYAVADAVGGTSVAAHQAALRRIELAGAKLISKTQLYCELQRKWSRVETVPAFMDVFQIWDGQVPKRMSMRRKDQARTVGRKQPRSVAAARGAHCGRER
jgi:hypothetical protein